jgi:hypothetical protein
MELPTDEHMSVNLTLTEEQLAQYEGQLSVEMSGKPSSLIARLFKANSKKESLCRVLIFFLKQVLTGKKVTIPGGSFKSSTGEKTREKKCFVSMRSKQVALWFLAVLVRLLVICTCWSDLCSSSISLQSTSCMSTLSKWSFSVTRKSRRTETLIWR